jgi:hypothetical protein
MVLRAARAPGNIASPERVRRATELMGRFMGAVTAGLSAIDAHRVARVVHEDFFFVGTACGEIAVDMSACKRSSGVPVGWSRGG